MTTIGSKDEWLKARIELLEDEKALTRSKDAVAEKRRRLPWVKLENDYSFETQDGSASLADLFGARSQLVVYHFMFDPEWDVGCKSCSYWADNFEGLAPHLAARDIAFAAVSAAPMEKIRPFKDRMGWSFLWVSSSGSTFNHDFDVSFDAGRPPEMSKSYNFGTVAEAQIDELPGTSVFAKNEHGQIFHTYSTYGRGLDATNAAYAYIDLTPKGRHEPESGNPMAWVRHHDDY